MTGEQSTATPPYSNGLGGRFWHLGTDVVQGDDAAAILVARAATEVDAEHIARLLNFDRAADAPLRAALERIAGIASMGSRAPFETIDLMEEIARAALAGNTDVHIYDEGTVVSSIPLDANPPAQAVERAGEA